MIDFTYETQAHGTLETYEWDNVWLEQCNHPEHPRIMYLGDSISCGIRGVWNDNFGDVCYCDNCGTSKAIDNPYLLPLATNFLQQMVKKPDVIFINNGLHGWHLSIEEYAYYYKAFLQSFQEVAKEIPIVLVKTTSVADSARDAIVVMRNKKVTEIAEEFSLDTIDLYLPSVNLPHTDGVHLSKAGYIALAEELVRYKISIDS